MSNTIITYCCDTWPSIGGIARWETHIKIVFPNRKFFEGPKDKDKMLEYLKTCINPIIITDNHLSCDIPNEYPILLIHHGVAQTHADRDPIWDPYWRDLCCNGQKKMLYYRNPKNTWIISTSTFCFDEFLKYYPDIYPSFKNILYFLTSKFDENKYKTLFNEKPIVLGSWTVPYKGKLIAKNLSNIFNDFIFKTLDILPNVNENLESFNIRKQDIYINADIYLQLSTHEGTPYATLDALINGLPIVATDTGLFYKDIPEDCFVKLDWKQVNDLDYVYNKLLYAWENKEILSKNAREWYMKNCRFSMWEEKFKKIVNEFYIYNYS